MKYDAKVMFSSFLSFCPQGRGDLQPTSLLSFLSFCPQGGKGSSTNFSWGGRGGGGSSTNFSWGGGGGLQPTLAGEGEGGGGCFPGCLAAHLYRADAAFQFLLLATGELT